MFSNFKFKISNCALLVSCLLLVLSVVEGFLFAPAAEAAITIRPMLNTGLVGYWNMDEGAGTTAYDRSGYGNAGTMINMDPAANWVDGKLGKALDFDGTDDYVDVDNVYSGVKTISFWINADDLISRKIMNIDGTDQIEINGSSQIVATSFPGTTTIYIDGAVASTLTAGWHHVVITNTTGVNASAMDIGRVGTSYFDGKIDEVRIYNRVLSPDEISRLYNLTKPKILTPDNTDLVGYWSFEEGTGTKAGDMSGKGNHGDITGATWTGGKRGVALHFNGASNYTEITDGTGSVLDIIDQITLSAWINPGQGGSAVTDYTIGSSGSNAWSISTAAVAPAPSNSGWNAASSGNKTAISANDESRWETRGTTDHNQYDYQMYHFAVATSSTLVAAQWVGYGENQADYNATLSVWNFTGSSWDEKDSALLGADGTLDFSGASATDYVQASGSVYILAQAKHYNYAPAVSDAGRNPFNGYEYPWDTTTAPLSWTAWSDEDSSDTPEYYAEVYNGIICAGGAPRQTRDWSATTSFTATGLTDMSDYSWRFKGRSSASYADNTAWNTCWRFSVAAGGTCPHLYMWNGKTWDFKTNTFGSGGLGKRTAGTGNEHFVKPIPNQIYPFENIVPKDGKLELREFSDLDEINYFDKMTLYAIDLPKEYTLVSENPTLGSSVDTEPKLHTFKNNLLSPKSAILVDTGRDVAHLISGNDDKKLILNEDPEHYSYKTIELDFGDLSSESVIKLVVLGSSSFPQTPEGLKRKQQFKDGAEILFVQDADGNWTKVPPGTTTFTKVPPVEIYQAYDISNIFISNNTKLRVAYLYKSYINQIALDLYPDFVPMVKKEIVPESMILRGFDYFHPFDKDGGTPDYNVIKKMTPKQYFPGNFTRFGDVAELLRAHDDRFVIMAQGDEIVATYEIPNDPILPNMKRSYVVDTTGTYKALGKSFVPMTVEPLPFKTMSNFPYPKEEYPYTNDADYQNYLDAWNTRTCVPGLPNCFDKNTGKNIVLHGATPEKTYYGFSAEQETAPQQDSGELPRSLNTNFVKVSATTPGSSAREIISKEGAYRIFMQDSDIHGTINSTQATGNVDAAGWRHVAMTYDRNAPSNQHKIYANGAVLAQGTLTDAISTNNNSLFFGSYQAGSNYFMGDIDEVRIYNRALSATEVANLYNSSKKLVKVNTSQNNKLTDGLVGLWSFNGPDMAGNTAFDRSGNNNHGTLTNGPQRTIGKVGQGLSFDGSNDIMTALSVSNITVGSFAMWIRPDTLPAGGDRDIVSTYYEEAESEPFTTQEKNIFITPSGIIKFRIADPSIKIAASSTALQTGNWHHIAATINGSVIKMYFNGALENSTLAGNAFSYSNPSFRIGGIVEGLGDGESSITRFQGSLDEVRIYNRALSADEVKRLYNMGR